MIIHIILQKESISYKCIVVLNAILHGANTCCCSCSLVANMLNNSIRVWLIIYLNHVQMTHLLYFSSKGECGTQINKVFKS